MTPYDQVAALYDRFPQPRTFCEDRLANIVNGYVISRREFFLMGRPVVWGHPEITNPWRRFNDPDCWFVQAAAVAHGISQNIFLTSVPFCLKWVTFARREGPLRLYNFQKLCAKMTPS